ncbi:MAG: mechanosensitive ion channel domain-containing protein [Granulosicoccus sp.]
MSWIELRESVPEIALQYSLNAVFALAIFVVGKWLARRAVNLGKRVMEARGFDPTVGGFISNIAYMTLLMLIIVAALSQLGIPTAQFIAIIGAAGLAIGLALQGSLSNFASGVLLVTFRPCKVGDYVEAAGVAGTVDHITVFSTTLVTPDQRTITVPNSSMLGGPIVNYTTSPSRRIDMVISVAYNSELSAVKKLLRKVVESDPRVLDSCKPVQIGVLALADSSINFAVRPWVANEHYWAAHFDLHERIKQAFDAADIVIPFPQMDVQLNKP